MISLTCKYHYHVKHHAFYRTHFKVKSLNYLVFSDFFAASLLCFYTIMLLHFVRVIYKFRFAESTFYPGIRSTFHPGIRGTLNMTLYLHRTEIIHCSLYAKYVLSFLRNIHYHITSFLVPSFCFSRSYIS